MSFKKQLILSVFIVVAFVGALIIVALLTAERPNESDLSKAATTIPLRQISAIKSLLSYHWVSSEEILILNLPGRQFTRFNVKTGEIAPEPILEKAVDPNNRGTGWSVSPNRQWLLTGPSPGNTTGNRQLVNVISGHSISVPQPGPSATVAYWHPDSSQWVEGPSAGLPGNFSFCRFSGQNVTFTNIGPRLPNAEPIGFAHDGHFLFRSNGNESTVTRLSIDSGAPVISRTNTITLPKQNWSGWTVCSPDGKKMVFVAAQPGRVQSRFLRNPPFIRIRKVAPLSLWVCDIEGKDLKKLGTLPENASIRGLQWNPDESRVSFVNGERLWIIPVE